MAKKPEKPEQPVSIGEKLDVIVRYLEYINRRDRMRMWGGFLRSLLGLIPLLIILYGLYYLYLHGGDVISTIIEQAARQAASITGQNADSVMKELERSGFLQKIQELLPGSSL